MGVQALTKALAGFGMGLLAGRFWVGESARAGARPRAPHAWRRGCCASCSCSSSTTRRRSATLMLDVILPQALYNGVLGAACCMPGRGRATSCCRRRLRGRRERGAYMTESSASAWGARASSPSRWSARSASSSLVGQLWYLQVLEGGRFRELSEKNRIRIRPVAAPRGILFDRNGLALVDNRPAFTLSLIPREMEDRDTGARAPGRPAQDAARRAAGGAGARARRFDPPGARAARPLAGGRDQGGGAQARAARAWWWRSSPSACIPPAPSRRTCWATSARSATSR